MLVTTTTSIASRLGEIPAGTTCSIPASELAAYRIRLRHGSTLTISYVGIEHPLHPGALYSLPTYVLAAADRAALLEAAR